MCKNYKENHFCKYGDRCLFAHGDHELVKRGSPKADPAKGEDEKKDEAKVEDKTDKVEEKEITINSYKVSNETQTTMDSTKVLQTTSNEVSDSKDSKQEVDKSVSNEDSKMIDRKSEKVTLAANVVILNSEAA